MVLSESGMWLSRARETLDDANILLDYGKKQSPISLLYYSALYCAKGLLSTKDVRHNRHQSIIRDFGKMIVIKNKFPKKYGRFLNKMYDKRDVASYSFSPRNLPRREIKKLLKVGNDFIVESEKYLSKN